MEIVYDVGAQMSRPRERIIRRAIAKPERVVIQRPRRLRLRIRAPLILPISFLVAILAGSLLLSLPVANNTGDFTPYDVAIFTATSAVCVTGLVVVDTGTYWSPFGQAVILLLIQLGGLGFITASTFLLILAGRRIGLKERMLLGTSQAVASLSGIIKLTRQVVLVTVVLEAIGAAILFWRFSGQFAADTALWMGVFHSISAFNNAGFDIIGNFESLIGYRDDAIVLLTIIILVILGGISISVLFGVLHLRAFQFPSFNTKLVLWLTVALLVAGTAGLFIMEFGNPSTFGAISPVHQVLNAFFMAATPRTAGFTTVDVGKMTEGSLLLIIALMYIGGAAGSAAGGIKVNTFGVLVAAVLSSAKGRRSITAFGREIPVADVARAMSIALLALGLIFLVTLTLTLTEPFPVFSLLFETTSAFGTVGLSTGLTPGLSPFGRMLIVLVMYVGRIGPLAVALVLVQRSRPEPYRYPEVDVRIG